MIKLGNSDITLKLGNDSVDAVYLGNTLVYSGGTPPTPPVPPHDYSQDYLTFVAKQDSTFTFSGNSIDYSIDNGSTWTTLASNTPTSIVATGDKIMWKATLTPGNNGIGRFSSTGQFDVEGNAMSLLYGDNFVGEDDLTGKNYAFDNLFSGCTNVVNAENMSLPATTLATNCYGTMFLDCTSLTTAPELPATTLVTNCYWGMFRNCTSLNYIKALFTTTPSATYTSNWVNNVAASGTFVKNSAATWNVTGVNGIPINWTVVDGTPKWVATYTGGIITSAECNSTSSITVNEITKANLESVVIGDCVSAIVGECFSDCSKLSAATINGYTSIDDYSFARNNGTLKTIIMVSTTPPPCANTAFTYYNHGYVPMTSITIYVPAESVEAYKAASGWSRYADKIQAIS